MRDSVSRLDGHCHRRADYCVALPLGGNRSRLAPASATHKNAATFRRKRHSALSGGRTASQRTTAARRLRRYAAGFRWRLTGLALIAVRRRWTRAPSSARRPRSRCPARRASETSRRPCRGTATGIYPRRRGSHTETLAAVGCLPAPPSGKRAGPARIRHGDLLGVVAAPRSRRAIEWWSGGKGSRVELIWPCGQ